jgi:hypothetical protein
MSIGEVSHSTRIRETIVRDIERDDYTACGGDFYARGHIRAIADVLHVNSVPLISEYDATYRAPDIPAASVFEPVVPIKLRERPRVNWTAVLAVLVVVALGVGGYLYFAGGKNGNTPAASGRAGTGAGSGAGGHGRHSPAADPPAKPRVQAKVLKPITATAVGTGGAVGDNSLATPYAIDPSPHTDWQTSVYTTDRFGGLESGTGLLLDLGKVVNVTSVRLSLGKGRGAAVELRVGNTPGLTGLVVVASARHAQGNVVLPLAAPVRARYVLIWFTRLAADRVTGGFDAKVYNVRLEGRSGRSSQTTSAS